MKATAKFDITNYVATHLSQEKTEVRKLAVEFKENKPDDISRLAGLAGHNDESKNLSDHEVIQLLSQATYKTCLSTQQFWRFCDADDIADIYAGQYTLEQLSFYAKSWARYPETIPEGNTQNFPTLEPKSVSCKQCQHFIPDQVGDGTGIGQCAINAPANTKILLWLDTEVICNQYKPTA